MPLSPLSPFSRSVCFGAASAALLCAAGAFQGFDRFGGRGETLARRLRTAELNKPDATLLQRGYYENLMGAGRFDSQLFEIFTGEPQLERFDQSVAARKRGDFLDVEMVPDIRTVFRGGAFSTNRWGFRGHDYEREPPARTFRMAVLGASITMGWGVADGEPFTDRLEERLNADAGSAPFEAYEVLNFAVAGYTPPQQLLQLRRALNFHPHAVLVVAHEVEIDRGLARIAAAGPGGDGIPLDSLQRAAQWAWQGATSRQAAERRLHPHRYQLLEWIYQRMADESRAHQAIPVWVFLPALDAMPDHAEIDRLAEIARRAGLVVVDLHHVYDGLDPRTLRIGQADRHPNPAGHGLVGRALDSALRATPALQPYLPAAPGGPRP
jgi:hypothetical protein